MNESLKAALLCGLVVSAFAALVIWEIRQYALARKGAGRPCRHRTDRQRCPSCRRGRSLFRLFGSPADATPEQDASDREQDVPEGDNYPKADPAGSGGESTEGTGQAEAPGAPAKRRRLRDLGVRIGVLESGPLNAITDVKGVKVGQTTLIEGDGKLVPGKGPVRTGVTAIIPHDGDIWNDRVTAGAFVLNGNGVVTGTDWIKELGFIDGPLFLTNTHSVGMVFDTAVGWMVSRYPTIGIADDSYLPVVGECDDSYLNDIRGRHVKPEHVLSSLNSAAGGPVAEGAVGAGTGMICYDFKGGIGTASRKVAAEQGGYTVGVLVNCNHGDRHELRVDGVPAGRLIPEGVTEGRHDGSIVIIIATDAPLNQRQLERIAARAAMGLARTGSVARNSSGDFMVAFSTSRRLPRHCKPVNALPEVSDDFISPLFEATAEATEEAILNALCMAETTVGRDGNTAYALPLDRLVEILRRHGRAS